MNVGGPGSAILVIVSSTGNSEPFAAHAGELEPAVQDDAAAALEEAGEPAPVRVAKRRRHDQLRHLAADGLARRVAEDRLCRTVPADHAALGVHRDDRVERRLEHRTQSRLAGSHLLLRLASRDELARPGCRARASWRAGARPARAARRRRTPSPRPHPERCAAGSRSRRAGRSGAPRRARGKLASAGGIDEPGGLAARQHPPRKALAGPSVDPLAELPRTRPSARPHARCTRSAAARRWSPSSQTAPSSPSQRAVRSPPARPRRPRQGVRFPRGSERRHAQRAGGRAYRRPTRRFAPDSLMASSDLTPAESGIDSAAAGPLASSWPTTTRCCARGIASLLAGGGARRRRTRRRRRRPAAEGPLLLAGHRDRGRADAAGQRRRRPRRGRRDPPRPPVRRGARAVPAPRADLHARARRRRRLGRRLPAQGSRAGRGRLRRGRRTRRGRRHRVRSGGREEPRRRTPPLAARRAHRPRARRALADRRGPLQPRDREAAVPQPSRRRAPRAGDLRRSSGCRTPRTTTAACSPCSRCSGTERRKTARGRRTAWPLDRRRLGPRRETPARRSSAHEP